MLKNGIRSDPERNFKTVLYSRCFLKFGMRTKGNQYTAHGSGQCQPGSETLLSKYFLSLSLSYLSNYCFYYL